MGEMVERLARKFDPDLWERIDADILAGRWLDSAHRARAAALNRARDAITELREPTEAMAKQGSRGWLNVLDRTDCGKESERYTRAAARTWNAMIDAALSQPNPPDQAAEKRRA